MLLTNKDMYKMSEASIAEAYSFYLQEVYIAELDNLGETGLVDDTQCFLGYDDFKDYYILTLVGKDNFIDKMVHNIQHGEYVRGT